MKKLIEIPELRMALEFDHKHACKPMPVRVAFLDGVPHFSARDLCEAMGWAEDALEVAFTLDYPQNGKRLVDEAEDGVPSNGVYLNPVACWYFAHLVDPWRGAPVASWSRRKALELCPSAQRDDPAFYLTIRENGEMPPRATKYTGRWHEWADLRYSNAYFASIPARVASRAQPIPQDSALKAQADADRQAVIDEIARGRGQAAKAPMVARA